LKRSENREARITMIAATKIGVLQAKKKRKGAEGREKA